MRDARRGTPWQRWAAVLVIGLAGCTTLGHGFDADGISRLVPGQTTFQEARVLLKAAPAQTYRAVDGSFQALWSHGWRGPVDSHLTRSAMLAFDSTGRFRSVVDTQNIIVDGAALDRQRRQAVCLAQGLPWPCDVPVIPPRPLSVPVPLAPAAVEGPSGCYTEGNSVTICPRL